MSGGSLDYFYMRLREHENDLGDKELNELVKDLAELFHDREWYLSCDTSEGKWREARDAFKAKWFSENNRQERIERYLTELADEVRDTLGVSKAYCRNCKHFTPKPEKEQSKYGNCDNEKHCLMHRSDKCEKFECKEDTK